MPAKARLQYLDWLRGLAVLLMIQVHVTDSFLGEDLRTTAWYRFSQYVGGWAAPLFLFMAGISLALVFDRLREKGASANDLAKKAVMLGGWILLLAYAFRVEQVLVWFPYAPWSDVLKVDILNCIGVSYILAGVVAVRRSPAVLIVIAAALALTTPVIAPTRGGIVLDYLHGNGHANYFPIFPWAAYTFAGVAVGYLLLNARKQGQEWKFLTGCAAVGGALVYLGYAINRRPALLFGLADYSRYSPHYVFAKMGYVLALMLGAYLWMKRPRADRWSPMLIFGQTSLLIYWLHIEFVYGRLRFFKNTLGVGATVAQLLWLIPLMLGIAVTRLRWKAKRVVVRDSVSVASV